MVDMNTGEKSNNLFGIKYRESIHGVGNYVEVWTKEYVSASELAEWKKKHPELKELGKENEKYKIQVIEKFAKFNSLDQAFEKYKETLLNNNFKHALRNADDIEKYLLDIQSKLPGETHATYATDPNYVSLILSVMKTYHIPTKVEEVPSVSVPTSSEKEAPNSNNSNSIDSNYLNYIIKSGDTLSDIARKYNTTVEELARLNGISNANAISVGKALKIPQHTIGGNNTSSEMTEDSKPQVQTNQGANIPKNAWIPVTPAVTNSVGKRSVEAYNSVIDQFNVTTHPRYTPGKYTYCNIFAWDVMSAMGVELPQRVDRQTNEPRLFPDVKGTTELNANGMAKWLENYGTQYGWVEVSAKEAQQAANRGEPTVTAWNNPGGIGHFQVVRPTRGNDAYSYNTGVYVAQAGGSNFDYKTAASVYGQGKAMDKIKYYTHK